MDLVVENDDDLLYRHDIYYPWFVLTLFSYCQHSVTCLESCGKVSWLFSDIYVHEAIVCNRCDNMYTISEFFNYVKVLKNVFQSQVFMVIFFMIVMACFNQQTLLLLHYYYYIIIEQ